MPGRAGRDHDDLLLDMILDRQALPPAAPPSMHALAAGLAALAAAPDNGDLPGQAAALAAFARPASPAIPLHLPAEPPRRGPARRLALPRARLAAAAAVVAVGLSGTAAAAYAGVLPAAVQNFAHHVIDAPPAHHGAQRGDGARHQSSHPGSVPPSPHPGHPAHPAKPGQHKTRKGHHHQAKHRKNPKPAHPAHPSHPTQKAHPSRSPSPASK
jgi:hypothetical protein